MVTVFSSLNVGVFWAHFPDVVVFSLRGVFSKNVLCRRLDCIVAVLEL